MYIHAFVNKLKAYFIVSARLAGIIYLVSNVSMFEQVSSKGVYITSLAIFSLENFPFFVMTINRRR